MIQTCQKENVENLNTNSSTSSPECPAIYMWKSKFYLRFPSSSIFTISFERFIQSVYIEHLLSALSWDLGIQQWTQQASFLHSWSLAAGKGSSWTFKRNTNSCTYFWEILMQLLHRLGPRLDCSSKFFKWLLPAAKIAWLVKVLIGQLRTLGFIPVRWRDMEALE